MNQTTKTLIGAIIAAVLAVAVYYGVISQQSATQIQSQANQTLGTAPATQQTGTGNTQIAPAGAPAPTNTGPASQPH